MISSAISGALNEKIRLETIANNLANINTVGFKADRAAFSETIKTGIVKNTTESDKNTPFLPNYEPFRIGTDFSPGQLKYTGNPLDIALEGNGFFSIETPDGIQFTRKGNFTINSEGILVTKDGLPVLGKGGKITIDGKSLSVDEQGNIYMDGKQIDAFKLIDFPKPYNLLKTGGTLFKSADENIQGTDAKNIKVNQGVVESSNVNGIQAMTEMIDTLRGYESYQKIIQFFHYIDEKAINDVGKLTQ